MTDKLRIRTPEGTVEIEVEADESTRRRDRLEIDGREIEVEFVELKPATPRRKARWSLAALEKAIAATEESGEWTPPSRFSGESN